MRKQDKIAQLESTIKHLKNRIKELEEKNGALPGRSNNDDAFLVPEDIYPEFKKAQKTVYDYFKDIRLNYSEGSISTKNERYILLRASAIADEFFNAINNVYSNLPEEESFELARNFLFDISHVIGMKDAQKFHKKMGLTNPIDKLSAGPIHFAFTGWASVEIHPKSNLVPNENFFLKYNHINSFEADSWIKSKKRPLAPVCILNAGYSSGWCEESFGIQLTSVEISCRALGDDSCTFIMAPPNKIENYLELKDYPKKRPVRIPEFFERIRVESELKDSLEEKEILLQELNHRVKNTLQVISSFINLQFQGNENATIRNALAKIKNRVNSMALAHNKLFELGAISSIPFDEYIKETSKSVVLSYDAENKIQLEYSIAKASFEISLTVNLGLIINELITNSCKYAFPDKSSGTIRLTLKPENDEGNYLLEVSDNGVGQVKKEDSDLKKSKIGLEIVKGLVNQINGQLTIESTEGYHVAIRFKG